MKSIGFDIEGVPFMSDRDHLLVAVRFLQPHAGIVVSIKFCLEHIIRSIQHRFHIQHEQVEKSGI